MSSGAGAGVTFLGTGAGVKKLTPITSGPYSTATRYEMVAKLSLWEDLVSCLINLCFG